ncbi:MAG TPA: error-prone DNA polymerase [Candidatus Binataceae bacterium]|nr:error-prone DNA polymerase [Candidatus Binataceae bacterium]
MTFQYVELRARSAFSFLEGATLPEDLIERAATLGYHTLALGDRDGLYGAPRFYHAARAAGIKPLVGAEISLDDQSRLYLLAAHRAGYQNLCRLITAAKLRPLNDDPSAPIYPAKGKGRVRLEDLERFGAGLVCLAGGARSPISGLLLQGQDPRPLCARLSAAFGRGNLYLDLQRHLDPDQERLNRRLLALAQAVALPIVATNDVCHGGRERALLDVLSCIRMKTTLDGAGRALWVNHERHLKAPTEMAALFADLPQAISATHELAARLEFTLADLGYRFPDYPLPPDQTPDSYLRLLTYAGARQRWSEIGPRVHQQLEHELALIAKLKLAGYFLIVWDIVQFCREHNILVQGRGSAANSAVCYALGITAVDAVGMELLFERFLSEERGEWPDIDLDLPSGEQRERVIQYLYRRYGARGAAMTANVITYRTRSAVREVGKVLGLTPDQVDRIAKLARAYEFRDDRDELAAMLAAGGVDLAAPRIGMLVELVAAMQNLPRHLGQHSGGMVIAASSLDEIVPLEPASMAGRVVIQWDKEDCADLGIIKVDLLGLGMLAVLEQAIPLIRQHEGLTVDLARLPLDDPATYQMLRAADTVGVFQVESRAQMATLPRMQPRSFYDLVVEVAIIRPGPIVGKMVNPYLQRRAGRAPVSYPHPSLEPILRRTLGVPLFQEQLLRMAMTAAGFSGGAAEELRRAMGFKRSHARMESLQARLREGMARNGIYGEAADQIIASVSSFALYGFPESHAASFALIAYASAYLKCHHPVAFYAALLNCYPMGFYHPATIVKDAQRHGLEVHPADVNRSRWECTIEPAGRHLALRLGLKYIAGLRAQVGDRIVAGAPFASLADLARRAAPNSRELDTLAYAGALATLGLERRQALWQAAALPRDPSGLFAGRQPPPARSHLPPLSALEQTRADYASTGLTTGPHLMTHLRSKLAARGVLRASDLASAAPGALVKVAGLVIVRQRPGTAKGFLFLTLEDESGIANVIVTPDLFQEYRPLLHRAPILLIQGVVQRQDGVSALRGRRFAELKLPANLPATHHFR